MNSREVGGQVNQQLRGRALWGRWLNWLFFFMHLNYFFGTVNYMLIGLLQSVFELIVSVWNHVKLLLFSQKSENLSPTKTIKTLSVFFFFCIWNSLRVSRGSVFFSNNKYFELNHPQPQSTIFFQIKIRGFNWILLRKTPRENQRYQTEPNWPRTGL